MDKQDKPITADDENIDRFTIGRVVKVKSQGWEDGNYGHVTGFGLTDYETCRVVNIEVKLATGQTANFHINNLLCV